MLHAFWQIGLQCTRSSQNSLWWAQSWLFLFQTLVPSKSWRGTSTVRAQHVHTNPHTHTLLTRSATISPHYHRTQSGPRKPWIEWQQFDAQKLSEIWSPRIVFNAKAAKGHCCAEVAPCSHSRCFLLRTAAKTAPVILMLQMPCMRSTMKTRRMTITSRSLTKYHRHSEAEETFSIPINAPSLLTSSWWEGVHSHVFLVYKHLLRTFMSS